MITISVCELKIQNIKQQFNKDSGGSSDIIRRQLDNICYGTTKLKAATKLMQNVFQNLKRQGVKNNLTWL